MSDIDLVIPMVFPSDPSWQAHYARFYGNKKAAMSDVRWRSWGIEELSIRCAIKYMPWLRRIHILLSGESQVQRWMETMAVHRQGTQPMFSVIFHREFIPNELLPCFNVNTIEMHLHRIPGLSEHFIYSNDDLIPLSPLAPEDFFRAAEPHGPLLPCQHHEEKPYPARPNTFQCFVKNGLDMVAADFGRRFTATWLKGGHSMQPMLRSTLEKVCSQHTDRISKSFTVQRSDKNYNQYIFPFWQHLSGQYIDHVPRRQYVGIDTPTSDIADIIREADAGIVCLNDNELICDWEKRAEIVRKEVARKLAII